MSTSPARAEAASSGDGAGQPQDLGPFIVAFEGLDSSGKTTQAELLAAELAEQGHRVHSVSFPRYDEFFGQRLKALLQGSETDTAATVDPYSMSFWYALDRHDYFANTKIDEDFLVVNRYSLSSASYQGARVGDDDQARRIGGWVLELEHDYLAVPAADLTIFLDVPSQVAVDRSAVRGAVADDRSATPDVYERSAGLQARARANYLEIAAESAQVMVVAGVDGSGEQRPADSVGEEILALVLERWRR